MAPSPSKRVFRLPQMNKSMSISSSTEFLNEVQISRWPDRRYAIIVVRRDHLYIAGLLVLSMIVCLYDLDTLKLWDIDEGMHAVMAQNMVRTGNWITPMFNGDPFFDKPVLVNWLGAISFAIFGFSEFAARLPTAILGVGCVITTFFIGRKIYDSDTGMFAALVLATSLEFIVLARQVQYDIPFVFLTTVTLFFFCSAFMDTHRRTLHLSLFYLAIALAVLTKGPLGLILPTLAVILFLSQQRRLSFLADMNLPMGILIMVVVAVPWFLLMESANPGYLGYFILKQHFANVFGELGDLQARHPRPIYYYLPILVVGFFPWSLILVGAVRDALRRFDDMSILLLIWIAVILLVFSISSSKLSTYILPLWPAAALLVGRYLNSMFPQPDARQRRGLLVSAAVSALAVTALAIYTLAYDPWMYWEQERGVVWSKLEHFVLLVSAMMFLVLATIWLRRYALALVAMTTVAPAMAFTVFFHIAPDAEPYNSAADIGAIYDRLLGPDDKMVFSTRMADSALFYSGRSAILLENEEQLNAYLDSEETVFVLLNQISRTDSGKFDGDYFVLHQQGNKAIVSNRPPDEQVATVLSGGNWQPVE